MKVYIEHMSVLQVLFAFFIDMLLEDIGIIFLHVNPIKTPEMLPSRETPGDFCDVVDLPHWRVFTLAYQVCEGFKQLRDLPWLLSVAYFCQTFLSIICLILLQVLWF